MVRQTRQFGVTGGRVTFKLDIALPHSTMPGIGSSVGWCRLVLPHHSWHLVCCALHPIFVLNPKPVVSLPFQWLVWKKVITILSDSGSDWPGGYYSTSAFLLWNLLPHSTYSTFLQFPSMPGCVPALLNWCVTVAVGRQAGGGPGGDRGRHLPYCAAGLPKNPTLTSTTYKLPFLPTFPPACHPAPRRSAGHGAFSVVETTHMSPSTFPNRFLCSH